MISPVRFKILGPLSVHGDEGELDLGGGRQRIVLAMLLLEANRTVPIDRLVEACWADCPPGTPRNQVQIGISRLRRSLGDTAQPYRRVITKPHGYLVRVEPDELDLSRFDELVAHSQEREPAEAAGILREALALWRGPVLSDADSDLVRTVAQGLEERRLLVFERCVELELSLGRHKRLVGELRLVTEAHPLRERPHGHLMLALYGAGRQAEALEVFRSYRATLLDTLGLEPGEELRRIESSILNHDEAIRPPHENPVPRQLPPVLSTLSGREAELGRIGALLSERRAAALPIVSVIGGAGVGKSELALHAAHRLVGQYPDGHLYVDLQSGALRPQDALARFLRALGQPAVPPTLEERSALFRSAVANRRMLLLLDNAESIEQVRPLLPGDASCAVLVTSRGRPAGLPGRQVIELDVLGPADAVELLAQDLGAERVAAEAEAVRQVVEQCGGLPLALRIAGTRLASWPRFAVPDLDVTAILQVGYRALSPQARTLFRRLGLVASPQLAPWLGRALMGGAEPAFDELVEASLLGRRGDHYVWHDLVRMYAAERAFAEDADEVRAAALASACAALLALVEETHRRHYGGHFTVLRGRVELPRLDCAQLVGEEPLAWLDTELPVLIRAIQQAAEHGLDELSWSLAMTAVTLFETYGYFDDWRAVSEVALAACRAARNARGEGAMLYSLSSLAIFQQRYGEAQPLVDAALDVFAEIGEEHGSALALRNAALLARARGDLDAALEHYGQALTRLRAAGDRAAEAYVLSNMALIHGECGRLDEADPLLTRALAIYEQQGVRRGQAQALMRLAELSLSRGRAEQALGCYDRALAIVREARDRVGEAYLLQGLGEAQLNLGREDDAERTLRRALDVSVGVGDRLIQGRARLGLGTLLRESGQLEAAQALFAEINAEPLRAKAAAALARVG